MIRILLIILAIALLCTAPAVAGTCTIRGTVTDADGRPVPGAQVTLFDGNRAEVTTIETDAGGNFAFVGARVPTDACAVRAFYNDRHQTYNNAAYFTAQYPATGDQAIPVKDTRLDTLHLSSASSSGPLATPGPSAIVVLIAYILVAASGITWNKRK